MDNFYLITNNLTEIAFNILENEDLNQLFYNSFVLLNIAENENFGSIEYKSL